VVRVVNISNTKEMSSNTSTDVLLNLDVSMSLQGEIETENKQSVDNCLLDRVASVDSRLVIEILCTTDCVVLLQRDVVSVSTSPSRPTNVSPASPLAYQMFVRSVEWHHTL